MLYNVRGAIEQKLIANLLLEGVQTKKPDGGRYLLGLITSRKKH